MDRSDVVPYLDRDWSLIAEEKAKAWLRARREDGPAGSIRVADALRQQVLRARPGWPAESERDRDLEDHVQLSRKMMRASPLPGR